MKPNGTAEAGRKGAGELLSRRAVSTGKHIKTSKIYEPQKYLFLAAFATAFTGWRVAGFLSERNDGEELCIGS